jgi:P4 family phage/plasmid primase-like protien
MDRDKPNGRPVPETAALYSHQDQGTAEALAVLVPSDAVVEVRILETGRTGTVAGFFDDLATLAREIQQWDGKAPGVYFTMNPVKPELLSRAANRLKTYAKSGTATSDHDVDRRCWVLVDIDPIRPAGICSTDDEHEAALECADKVAAYLEELDWPEPTRMDSGNGAYVLVPVELPNDDASRDLVERFLGHLAGRFNDDRVKVDTSVHNAARIMRVPGTLNAKGDDTAERPHRRARLLYAPDHGQVVDAEQLASVLDDPDPEPYDNAAQPGRFDLEAFIAEHLADNVASHSPWKGDGHKWVLSVCPFNPDHARGEAVIVRHPSGAIAAKCQHDSCTWKWRDLRKLLDPDAYTRKAGPKGTDDRFTDAMMAETVAEEVMTDRFIWTAGLHWLTWNGHKWAPCSDVTVGEAVRSWSSEQFKAAVDELLAGRGNQETVDGWRSMLQAHKEGNVLKLARGLVEHQVAELDTHPDLLNTPAGIVDLRTGELLPHDPDLMMRKCTGAESRPGYRHPDWDKTVEAIPPDIRDWVQMRLGQALTGHMTSDDKLPIFQGAGENGKTTVLDTCGRAAGDYYLLVSDRILLASPDQHPTELVDLQGVRLAVAEETPEARRLSVNRLKKTVGTPRITARKVHKDDVTFDATHSLMLSTNYRPLVEETDRGTWRRLALVRFPYTFRKPGEDVIEGTNDRRGDPTLRDRVKLDPDVWAAALTWMIEGARRWYDNGKILPEPPARVEADTRDWRAESDQVLAYLDDRLRFDPTRHVMATDLLEDLNTWLAARGHRPWSDKTLAARFGDHEEIGYHRVEKKKTRQSKALSRPLGKAEPGSPFTSPGDHGVPQSYAAWHGVRFVTDSDLTSDVPAVPAKSKLSYESSHEGSFQSAGTPGTDQEQHTPCPSCGAVVTYPQADGGRWCSTCGKRWEVAA